MMEISLCKECTHKQQIISDGPFGLAHVRKRHGRNAMELITHNAQCELVCVLKNGGHDETVFLLE